MIVVVRREVMFVETTVATHKSMETDIADEVT